MLQEKQSYLFRVLRLLTLPDGSQNWLLTHHGGDRYLLPAALYTDYGIEAGQTLNCLVDKINCTGKIFLEPRHPHYSEGQSYRFILEEEQSIEDGAGNQLYKLIFKGVNGEPQTLVAMLDYSPFKAGDAVWIKIKAIRKGKPVLVLADEEPFTPMKEGEKYTFWVTAITGHGLYEITGPLGIKAFLETQMYSHHGLEVGRAFRGCFLRWHADGYPLIEPEHPVYTAGECYQFRVLRSEDTNNQQDKELSVWIAEDCFGHEIKVFPGIDDRQSQPLPEQITCLVEKLKKGKPVLRIKENGLQA